MTDAPDPSAPRLMLATPPRAEARALVAALTAALDTGLVAAVRLDRPGAEEAEVRRLADLLRPLCHEADVPLLIADHYRLVRPLGLDGAEVRVPGARLREVREEIGRDQILGAACGASRHDGLSAAEAGVDYVLFRPLRAAPGLGDGAPVEPDLFFWWAEMIETPVVAEGGLTLEDAAMLGPHADFVMPDPEVWAEDAAALAAWDAALRAGPPHEH